MYLFSKKIITKATYLPLIGLLITVGAFVCSAQLTPSGAGNTPSQQTVSSTSMASLNATPPPNGGGVSISEIIPYLCFVVPVLIMMFFLARRKGHRYWPYFFLGLIPLVNILAMLWLLSFTDAYVILALEDIKKRLKESA